MFNLYLGNNHLVGKCRWGLSRAGQIESNKKVRFATSNYFDGTYNQDPG